MKSLVLFGDSLLGRFNRDYTLQLENSIKDITVYNCATGGFNSRDGLKRANFIAKLKPDYILLSLGANDAIPENNQPVSLNEFKENLISIIKAFAGSTIILFTCPYVDIVNNQEETGKFNGLLKEYNSVVKNISLEKKIHLLNSEKIYRSLKDYHMGDGLHMNKLGYDVLIRKLTQLIKE
ncbi:MAG: GDSL-type esterase/lipase family protein [Candidatus Paceibacterota bacterium]